MAKCKQTNKKRSCALLLTLILLLVSCAYIFSACGTSSDDEEEDTTKKTDTQTFANADFEYFNDNNGGYRIATPDSWSRSSGSNALGNSAASSLAKSGIVDTSLDWGTVFPQAKADYDQYKDTDAEDIPDEVNYYTDIDSDYDMPGWDIANDNKEGDTLENEALKAAVNAANPGTHWSKAADKDTLDKDKGTNVLMLHNYRSDREQRGTAAKYTTTSSITLQANTAAKVSVWVKTYGMTDYLGNEVTNASKRGAYISVSNSVGGTAQEALFVNNINTSGITDNNGWVQYTFYVKASNYATTSFNLVLGLGQGGGNNKLEYVDGYAFFDDIEYRVLTADEYDKSVEGLSGEYTYNLNLLAANDENKKDATVDTRDEKIYALNLYTLFDDLNNVSVTSKGLTKDDKGNTVESFNDVTLTDTRDIQGDITTATAITASSTLSAKVKDAFEKYPFADDGKVLLIASYKGANYTAKLGNLFTVQPEEYCVVSFWVKTSDLKGGTGATITLRDKANTSVIGAVDTTTLSEVTLKDDSGKKEDIFDGWQQCFFFVENQTKQEQSFTLEFSFGPTSITDTALTSYSEGFAAFTGFEYKDLTEEEFALKSTGTYAVSASLLGDYKSATVGGGFDDVAHAPTDKIESDFADTLTYDGVYGNSNYVGGDSDVNVKNDHTTAGLLNKAYANDGSYSTSLSSFVNWFVDEYKNSYTSAAVTADNWWNAILGNDVNQPLFIANTTATAQTSYGYVAKNASSISASSYTAITYRVMLSQGATAYLYLIDTTEPENLDEARYSDTLNFNSGVSYYYDGNGNLVGKNPEDDDFSAKHDTLLYRQNNGLWAESKNYKGRSFYANLANYEEDENKNLIDSSDNIVYYYNEQDQSYYRHYDETTEKYSVKVQDFTKILTVDQLAGARIQEAQKIAMVQKIEGTEENAFKWINVTFYIANGDTAKNYRLEVWNGSRDNQEKMAADSIVIFDKVSSSTLDATSYGEMLDETLLEAFPSYPNTEKLAEAYAKNPQEFIEKGLVYYHYSLFDDCDYKPYDKDYDKDNVGDPYSEYDGTSY